MTQVAAFFDLDRTLIDVNSALLYAKYERRQKRIGLFQLLTTSIYSVLYHLNILDMEAAYSKALKNYAGISESEMERNVREFFFEEVDSRLQPGARRALDFHRSQGHQLVLLSTSSSYQAQAAVESWGLDDAIANRFPSENGLLTGKISQPFCYGSGKVVAAEEWLEGRDIELKHCYFYSDSFSDLPMLLRVGFPKVVNPDPKLKSYTKRARWEILDWRR